MSLRYFFLLFFANTCKSTTVSVSSTISRPNNVSIISSKVTIPLTDPNSSITREICSLFFKSLSNKTGILDS